MQPQPHAAPPLSPAFRPGTRRAAPFWTVRRAGPLLSLGLSLGLGLGLALVLGVSGCAPDPAGAADGSEGDRSKGAGGGLSDENRGLMLLDTGPAPGADADAPRRPDFHSFGEVSDGLQARHTFRLRNVEATPIAIEEITPGCGCTAAGVAVTTATGESIEGGEPEEEGEPWIVVPPGAELALTLSVDTRDIASKNKDRTLSTRVLTDSQHDRYLTFELHLFVAQDLQVVPKRLDLGEVGVGVGGSGLLELVPVGGREAVPTEVVSGPEGVRFELAETAIQGVRAWQVVAHLEPPLELGPVYGTIDIATERPDGSPGSGLKVPFLARVVEDLRVAPARLVLIERGPSDERGVEVELSSRSPGERLVVTSARLEGEGSEDLELAFEPVQADARGRSLAWRVRLTPAAGAAAADGVRTGEVVVELERSRQGVVRIPWVWHPRR